MIMKNFKGIIISECFIYAIFCRKFFLHSRQRFFCINCRFVIINKLSFKFTQLISQFINETSFSRTGDYLDEGQVTFIWSWIVSIFCLGGIIGAMGTGFIADKLGRSEIKEFLNDYL